MNETIKELYELIESYRKKESMSKRNFTERIRGITESIKILEKNLKSSR